MIEKLSETRLMRRAAQITVGVFQSIKAGSMEKQQQITGSRFIRNFKQEIENELKKEKLRKK